MSTKTVAQKLMIKPGHKVLFVNAPAGYEDILGPLPPDVTIVENPQQPVDFIQLFAPDRQALEQHLGRLKSLLKPGGMLWVTYYKGTSKKKTDIHRDSINDYARTLGMEGIFIISVNEDWSALRLKVV